MILFPWQKGKCTEETTGEIAGTRWDGDYIHLYVAYTVDEKEYHLHEQMTYHVVREKNGKIPIGRRRIPAIQDIKDGSLVKVRYNPGKPKHAYLPDNNGVHM